MVEKEQYREKTEKTVKKEYSKDIEHKGRQIILLAAAAITIFCGSILFVGAAAGWFSGKPVEKPVEKVSISSEFIGNTTRNELTAEKYQKLKDEKKSFILISHLPDCQAKILGFMKQYSEEHQIAVNYMLWSEYHAIEKNSGIKYAPTVVIYNNGKIVDFLKSDSDADTAKYNNYEDFRAWLDSFVNLSK
ncbi:hypothetical protein J6T21_03080 [Candidatus Saccharibacteria bacterium]|nr:hypothetical protein [Candidatus Saccharibacteria bacterium]